MKVRSSLLISDGMIAAPAFGACSDAENLDAALTANNSVGPISPANPASAWCIEQGGQLDIFTEGTGQVGYCNLPDGTRISEWDYFRSQTSSADSSSRPDDGAVIRHRPARGWRNGIGDHGGR